jgi:hypothetical protein
MATVAPREAALAQRPTILFLVCVVLVPIPFPVVAQGSLGVGAVYGASFERFGDDENPEIAFGYHRSRLTRGGPAEDLAVRLFPSGLSYGAAVVGLDAGIMQALALGPVAVFVKGGGGALTAIGFGDFIVIPALHGGVGALVKLERRSAIRVDITRYRFYPEDRGAYGIWSVSLGFAVLPRAAGGGQR